MVFQIIEVLNCVSFVLLLALLMDGSVDCCCWQELHLSLVVVPLPVSMSTWALPHLVLNDFVFYVFHNRSIKVNIGVGAGSTRRERVQV